jgi:hypothetical protein
LLIVLLELGKHEVDNGIRKDSYDKSDDGIKDSVLGARDSTAVTVTSGITDTTDDNHDHGDGTEDIQ